MGAKAGRILIFVLAAAGPQMPGQDKFELPLGSFGKHGGSGTSLSLGSVGLDSHAGNTYVPRRGGDPYYFRIPSERPFKKVPGLLLKIPFASDRLPW